MAIRSLVLNLGSGSDVQAVSGHILINRHTAGSTDAGLWIFDSPERVVLTNPARTVPLEVGVAYKFDPVIPEGSTIYAYMTAGTGDLNYLDLVPVDPSTLLPGADPGPAWVTALASTNATVATKANTVDVRVLVKPLEAVPAFGFGHSFGSGTTGAEVGSHAIELVAKRNLTAAFNNQAVSGSRMDQINAKVRANYSLNARAFVQIAGGTRNDQNAYGSDANGTPTTAEAFRGTLAWLTSRLALASTDNTVLFDGGWTTRASSTPGSKYQLSFNGDAIWIQFAAVTTTGAVLTITNDAGGATLGTINTGGYGNTFEGCKRISGLDAGDHVISVTLTSGSTTVPANVALIPNPTPPLIVWHKEPAYNLVTAQNTLRLAYQAACAATLTDFPGLPIVVVEPPADWDAVTCTVPDGVHPNSLGHELIANAIDEAMNSYPVTFMQGLNNLVGSLANNDAYAAPAITPPPPAPTVYVADDFNRADGALGNTSVGAKAWSVSSAATSEIVGNQGQVLTSTSGTLCTVTCVTAQTRGTVKLALTGPSSQSGGVVAFCSSATAGWVLYWSGTAWAARRFTNNSFAALPGLTVVNTPPTIYGTNPVVAIVKTSAANLLFKINGVTIWSSPDGALVPDGGSVSGAYTNSNLTTGATPTFDSFEHNDALV